MNKKISFISFTLITIIVISGFILFEQNNVRATLGQSRIGLYKNDGTTYLGELLSVPNESVCAGFVYYDNTGEVKKLSSSDCTGKKIGDLMNPKNISVIRYDGENCTGNRYLATTTFSHLETINGKKYVFEKKQSGYESYMIDALSSAVNTTIKSFRTLTGFCSNNLRNSFQAYPINIINGNTFINAGECGGNNCKLKDLN